MGEYGRVLAGGGVGIRGGNRGVLAGYVQEGEVHKKEPTECSEVATIFAEEMLADRNTDTVKIYHPPWGI